jgi:predicted CXXCH cytochrome family protein
MGQGSGKKSPCRRDGYNAPVPLFRGLCRRFAPVLAGSLAVAACGSGTSAVPGGAAPSNPAGSGPVAGPAAVPSNVTRQDYAGSAACASCHPDETAAWRRSPMHGMTRDARDAEVRAPFDGTRWPFKNDAVVLEKRGVDRFVRIESAGTAVATYRVTRVIGGRTREDFAGVDVAGGSEEIVLPVSFVYGNGTGGSLRYKGYSVMVHERATLRAGPVWSRTCIFCHNTVPELDRLIGAVAGRGAHPYQAGQVDSLLPVELRSQVQVTSDDLFSRAVDGEVAHLGGRPASGASDARARARAAVDVVRAGFDGGSVVEVGIGCEACHGGARAHSLDPAVHPSMDPQAPWLQVATPRPSRALSQNRMCARCHQVLFSKYPFTWEGGRRDSSPGGSHISSGEGRDFLLGGCAGAMACTTCHDPHGADPPGALAQLATPAGNGKCTSCHGELSDPQRLRAHAHHDPGGAGGSCIGCHMPRKNMGLGGSLTRYHRIGKPTDPARVLGDRPLECALCHTDRSVSELVDAMEKWWPVRFPRQRLAELYGSLDANVVRATLDRGKAHEQAVAIGLLGEARARDAAPAVARQLHNEYPLVRQWAQRALDAMGAAGPPAPLDQGKGTDEDPED